MSQEGEECYSANKEEFYDDLESVIEYARYHEVDTLYVGKKTKINHSDFLNPHLIIEQMQEEVCEKYGTYLTDTYLEDLKKEDMEELKVIIANFLEKKTGPVFFYGITDIKEVPISELEEQSTGDKSV